MRTSFAALTVVALLAGPAAADKQFNVGSLIIPTGSAYQTDCGAVAVYGLVYDILRANAWLATQSATVAPGGAIQVYYAYKAAKGSPNRCTPTDKNTDPTTDAKWIDGCDFKVFSSTTTPVQLVDNTGATADANITTRDTSAATNIYPTYAAQVIDHAVGVTTVRYLGAPFIIDDKDAPTFLKLLNGTLLANDKADGTGNTIDFTPFRTGAGSCSFSVDTGGYVNIHRAKTIFSAPAPKAFTAAPPRLALLATKGGVSTDDFDYKSAVTISAQTTKDTTTGAFQLTTTITFRTTAKHGLAVGDHVRVTGVTNSSYNNNNYTVASVPNTKAFTVTVASGALARSGGGTVTRAAAWEVGNTVTVRTSGAHGLFAGNQVDISGAANAAYNGTWTITNIPTTKTLEFTALAGIAPEYDAGAGQVTKVVAATTRQVSDNILQKYLRNAGLVFNGAGGCPPGGQNVGNTTKCPNGGVHGQIYDTFDFADFQNNLLDSSYKMVWTPHWEMTSDPTTDPNSGEIAVLGKIATFLDGHTGLMAECHSIESFEGAYLNGASPGTADASAGGTSGSGQRGSTAAQFQTCVGSAGVCSGSTTKWGLTKQNPNPTNSNYYTNCTDPGKVGGNVCTYFSDPGDPFAQPGDFTWRNNSGSVQNFKPNTNQSAIYRPGVSPLISGVLSLDTSVVSDPVAARAMIAADYATRSNKDNDTAKGNIVYVAGHDVSGVVAGTKVILQTLLLLGEPTIDSTTIEVSRSSPITAQIGNQVALVQGTFERVDPPKTTLSANTDGEVDAFRFPDLQGHMRAVTAASVTTQTNLKDATVIFDAAENLPATACDTTGLYGSGTGGCRTVWTNTAGGAHPANVVFNVSATTNSTLKTLINTNGGFGATGSINTNFATFLDRIKAGDDTSGSFLPKLGGVDRSSVAAVSQSLVAGGSRPKVLYFGATDGMLHAVCAAQVSGTGCDVAGREIWAYIPRLQLPLLRQNTAAVDGSPRVMDVYGDFAGTGSKSFRTILMFQTGAGDPETAGIMPSVVALDVTDPFAPTIVWDYALANPGTRASYEMGRGLVLAGGPVRSGGVFKNYVFVQTSNGGTSSSGVGNVVTAIDMETGQPVWRHGVDFPQTFGSRTGAAPTKFGIPGGAVGVDKTSSGGITDVVFGTLYGEVYQLDAATGMSREDATPTNPGTPLFHFTDDAHPIGASPAIYSNGGQLFAVVTTGGYQDLSGTMNYLDPENQQYAVAVSLSTPLTALPPLDENDVGGTYVPWMKSFEANDKSFAQAIVIGGEVFITTDSLDINDNSTGTAYGLNASDTGKVYHLSVNSGADAQTVVAVRGGAGSVNSNGTDVFAMSKDKAQKLDNGAASTTGESPGSVAAAKITRLLWLRTL